MECNAKDASVVWQPMGDNRAPILTYKIQYNTSFTPDTWETATGKITGMNIVFFLEFYKKILKIVCLIF